MVPGATPPKRTIRGSGAPPSFLGGHRGLARRKAEVGRHETRSHACRSRSPQAGALAPQVPTRDDGPKPQEPPVSPLKGPRDRELSRV